MKEILLYVIAFMTFTNICMSIYMEYISLTLVRTCPCVKDNYHWYVVVIYFAMSIAFLSYSMLYIWHYTAGRNFFIVTTMYTIATIWFVISGFKLTDSLKAKECTCDMGSFSKLLLLISTMRTIMASITVLTLGIWLTSLLKK